MNTSIGYSQCGVKKKLIVVYDVGKILYICGGKSNEREDNRLYSENLY